MKNILEYQICPLVPLILIKKCLFPSFPLVCALGRPASMPVTSPRWDILGKLEKEEAMDYLQTLFANENLLAGTICTTLWQCSPSGTWVVMPLGLTAVLGGFRTAWVAKSSRILRWWWWVTNWLQTTLRCNNCCDLASASVTFSNFELTHARDSNIPEVSFSYFWCKLLIKRSVVLPSLVLFAFTTI